jgi:RNA polymerase sigma-70 factor (ECF subfamily)
VQESFTLGQASEAESRHAELLDGLAAESAGGDRSAFEQIYNQTVDDIFGYVRGQCRNDTVAEDLVANVYLKAWRSARLYRRGSNSYRRWLFAIARNELRDHWRTNQPTVPFLDLDVPDDNHTESRADPAEARREVARVLAMLTEEQRQVVVLRFFNNKSHEEIAAIMGKRQGAVRALLLRALRHMRKVMSDATP